MLSSPPPVFTVYVPAASAEPLNAGVVCVYASDEPELTVAK